MKTFKKYSIWTSNLFKQKYLKLKNVEWKEQTIVQENMLKSGLLNERKIFIEDFLAAGRGRG